MNTQTNQEHAKPSPQDTLTSETPYSDQKRSSKTRKQKRSSKQSAQSPDSITPAELADRYTFIKEIGSGAQGKVFLAKRRTDDQQVAIKQLRIDSIKTWKEYTLFHREADVLASLAIPGVVKFYEASDYLEAQPPCSYIVQEYIEGMSLKEMLSSGFRFSLNRVYDLVLQLIDILEKLHTHEPPIIHRDIKPSNIILKQSEVGDSFQVYLIDFGAVANPQIQSGGSTIAGTFGYMSPEQNIGRPTPQSDTYALGALTAYLISGVDPADMKTQDLRLVIDPYVENHPTALVQTLRRMLEPDIQNRLADLSELRKRFTQFKAGKYVLENENYSPYSARELRKKLQKVNSLCQPQNLEIWQNLPDLPENRPDYPIKLTTHPLFELYPTIRYDKLTKEKQVVKAASINIFAIIALAAILMPLLLVIGLMLFNYVPWIHNLFLGHDMLYPILTMMFGLFVAIEGVFLDNKHCPFFYFIFKKIFSSSDDNMKLLGGGHLPWIEECQHISAKPCPNHIDIFKRGRKTIATVTDIQYIHLEELQNFRRNEIQRVERAPCFRIFYKFNPPDDDTEYDIIHSILIHKDPTGMIKSGDPLPILYVGKGTPMHVTQSMPYPFPIYDLESPDDYIACSSEQ